MRYLIPLLPFLVAADGSALSDATTLTLGVVVWLLSIAVMAGVYKTKMAHMEERIKEDRAQRDKVDEEAKKERERLRDEISKGRHDHLEAAIVKFGEQAVGAIREAVGQTSELSRKLDQDKRDADARLRALEMGSADFRAAMNELARAAGNYEEMDRRVRALERPR